MYGPAHGRRLTSPRQDCATASRVRARTRWASSPRISSRTRWSTARSRAPSRRARRPRRPRRSRSAPSNIPSAADLERLTRRVRSVSQRLEGIEDGVDRLDERFAQLNATGRLEERLEAIEAAAGRHRQGRQEGVGAGAAQDHDAQGARQAQERPRLRSRRDSGERRRAEALGDARRPRPAPESRRASPRARPRARPRPARPRSPGRGPARPSPRSGSSRSPEAQRAAVVGGQRRVQLAHPGDARRARSSARLAPSPQSTSSPATSSPGADRVRQPPGPADAGPRGAARAHASSATTIAALGPPTPVLWTVSGAPSTRDPRCSPRARGGG